MLVIKLPLSIHHPDLEAMLGDTPWRSEFVKLSPRIHPRGGYRLTGFEWDPEGVTIEGIRVQSLDLARHLRGAERLAIMALTLGGEVDEAIEGAETRRAFILDAIASAAAEGAAEALSDLLRREGPLGDRYSPGYGDWPIQGNEAFAHWLDLAALGIRLLPGGGLWPRKSITALAGFGSGVSPCKSCPLERCVYPCPRTSNK